MPALDSKPSVLRVEDSGQRHLRNIVGLSRVWPSLPRAARNSYGRQPIESSVGFARNKKDLAQRREDTKEGIREETEDGDEQRIRFPSSFYQQTSALFAPLRETPPRALRLCERDSVRLESLTYGSLPYGHHGNEFEATGTPRAHRLTTSHIF